MPLFFTRTERQEWLHLHRMDSLTQIVLGAAVGEIALGKKIGNRALIWGGIGGTIPDLDVIANSFLDPIDALAFHRGITHSIFFSITGAFVFGWLVHRLYASGLYHQRWYRTLVSVINALLVSSITWGINSLFRDDQGPDWIALLVTIPLAGLLLWRLYRNYLTGTLQPVHATYRDWIWLFFLALFTHIVLDCFTSFGTQVFMPFSDFRVAFNNIAVADPAYTLPFLICVIIVACLKRGTKARLAVNWLGIGISSLYMLWSIFNKINVDQVFAKALEHRSIQPLQCRASPTILNNILWNCVAEDQDHFYVGQYSLFDTDPNLHYLNVFPKNDSIHDLLKAEEDYQTLLWFSDGYLAAFPTDTAIILADMRFGGMYDTLQAPQDLIFKFSVKQKDGEFVFDETGGRPQGNFSEMLAKFIDRIKGY